jgi:hypothetical protein
MARFRKLQERFINGDLTFQFGGLVPELFVPSPIQPTPSPTPSPTATITPTPTPSLTPGLVSKSMAVRVFDTTNSDTITGTTFSIDINSQNYNFSPLNDNTIILCESGFTGIYSGLTYSLELNIPNGWELSQALGGFSYNKLEITFDIELTPNSVWQTTFNYYLNNVLVSSSTQNLTINASGMFSCPINNFVWITNQGFQFYVKPLPTPSPTATITPTPSPTATITPTPSITPTTTPTKTPTTTPTPTITQTSSPTPTSTLTPTPTPSTSPDFFYEATRCDDLFSPTFILRSSTAVSNVVSVVGDDTNCYVVGALIGIQPIWDYDVIAEFVDCPTCEATL